MAGRKKTGVSKRAQNAANWANAGYEAHLCQAAEALQGSMGAAEDKPVVLGLSALPYILDAPDEHHGRLGAERASGAHPEGPDEFWTQSVFCVPPAARRSHLEAQTRQLAVGQFKQMELVLHGIYGGGAPPESVAGGSAIGVAA